MIFPLIYFVLSLVSSFSPPRAFETGRQKEICSRSPLVFELLFLPSFGLFSLVPSRALATSSSPLPSHSLSPSLSLSEFLLPSYVALSWRSLSTSERCCLTLSSSAEALRLFSSFQFLFLGGRGRGK